MSRKRKQDPFVLVYVRGGVAEAEAFGGAGYEKIDWDDWDTDDMAIGQLVDLAAIVKRVPDPARREALIGDVRDIAVHGIVYDDLDDKIGDARHDREVAEAAGALRFFGLELVADELEDRQGLPRKKRGQRKLRRRKR